MEDLLFQFRLFRELVIKGHCFRLLDLFSLEILRLELEVHLLLQVLVLALQFLEAQAPQFLELLLSR